MEKIHIERHDAAYRIDGLTLTEGDCLFHLRQKHIPGRLLPLIRRSLHTKQAVTLCRASDQDDWMILFPWNVIYAGMVVDRGTLVVTLFPTGTVNRMNKSVKSAWAGLATAELDDVPLTADGVRSSIDEMFRQSPFLAAGGSVDQRGGRSGTLTTTGK